MVDILNTIKYVLNTIAHHHFAFEKIDYVDFIKKKEVCILNYLINFSVYGKDLWLFIIFMLV